MMDNVQGLKHDESKYKGEVSHCMTVTGHSESDACRQLKLLRVLVFCPNYENTSQIIIHKAQDSHLEHIIPFCMRF